jgi:hypothetical protein
MRKNRLRMAVSSMNKRSGAEAGLAPALVRMDDRNEQALKSLISELQLMGSNDL